MHQNVGEFFESSRNYLHIHSILSFSDSTQSPLELFTKIKNGQRSHLFFASSRIDRLCYQRRSKGHSNGRRLIKTALEHLKSALVFKLAHNSIFEHQIEAFKVFFYEGLKGEKILAILFCYAHSMLQVCI